MIILERDKKGHFIKGHSFRKGSKYGEDSKKRMSESLKGRDVWNKGLKGIYSKEVIQKLSDSAKKMWAEKDMSERNKKISVALKGKKKSKKHSEKIKKSINGGRFKNGHISINKGGHLSKETRRKISKSLKGKKRKPFSEEHKRKMSIARKGANGSNWKGGVTPINKTLRRSLEYRIWREKVFKYDNYTCWICEERGGILHPHHLLKFSDYPELRFKSSNGMTLCEYCHKTYTKFGVTKKILIKTK